jgi:type I restriction enzyme M protein
MNRGKVEKKIRQYLVEHNFVDAIIQLPDNLFYGSNIATCIMVLKKNKSNSDTLFIDASEEFIKVTNNNKLTPDNIAHIMEAYESRQDIPHFAKLVSLEQIQENDYNLSVSSFVEKKDTSEKVDIVQLNAQIRDIVAKEQQLRDEIDRIIAEIEGDALIPQHQATLNI